MKKKGKTWGERTSWKRLLGDQR